MTRLIARCAVRYPGFHLAAELDLSLGGVAALFGPSGSGKTTLLRALAGLERETRGYIACGGEVWQDDEAEIFTPAHRRGIGFVFQDARLFPHLTVKANLEFGLRRTPPALRRVAFDDVVDVLDLSGVLDRRPATLSGGEAQRVAIARAVLASPRFLVMDEPAASLDAARKEEVLGFVEGLGAALGLPILYVSHALDEVLRLAGTLILIEDGRILATGPIEEVTNRLDLSAYTGRLDAGAVVRATVKDHDARNGLTRLAFAGGDLLAPGIDVEPGTAVNVRVRSRDVSLSLEPPRRSSILNILPGRVVEIHEDPGPHVHVHLDVGCPLWARIMKKSVVEMGLGEGTPVYALIEAVAVDWRSLGRPTAMDLSLRPK